MKVKGSNQCIARASKGMESKGFFLSFEAVCSLILLTVSASMLPMFSFQRQTADAFYICSDAAMLLSKTGASGDLQGRVDEIGRLSGLCVSFYSDGEQVSSCGGATGVGGRYSFPIIIWKEKSLSNARVSCWHPG